MRRIDLNVDLINKMIFIDQKEVSYFAEWMRILTKILLDC